MTSETARMNIELLVHDGKENPIDGPRFPRDLGVVRYEPENPGFVAYRHAFYRIDEDGQPVEDSIVEFYVPFYLLRDGIPNAKALRIVQRKMDW